MIKLRQMNKDHLMIAFLFSISLEVYSQENKRLITLDRVINTLSLISIPAQIEKLNYHNDLLLFENYKKAQLPSLSFNIVPINFNRSLRLLQHPNDGSYSYVDDYSNSSSLGISLNQKIGLTGGDLNVSSNINYLNEFSKKQNSFSTSPFIIGYSQQLWGGGKNHRLEKNIEFAKNQISIKKYCSKISQVQQDALSFFMTALLSKLESNLAIQDKEMSDSLLYIAKVKLDNGNITEYDFKQIELQHLNAVYSLENAAKEYSESLQRLLSFLGIDENESEIEIPKFDLPISMDIPMIMSYVKKNNPFFIEKTIEALEAEKTFYSMKVSNQFNGNISLNYGMNQYAETFFGAYRRPNTQQSMIIGLQIPIFQWGINKNKIRIAKNNYQVNKLSIEKSMREFCNEIKERVNKYNHSINLWFVAEKAYRLSQEQYILLVKKFLLGKVSAYEITSAQREQNSTMQRYYSVIKDSYAEYFALRHLTLYDFKENKELEHILINN